MANKGEAIWAAAQEVKMQEHLRRIAESDKRNVHNRIKNKAVDIFEKERSRGQYEYKE